jgi:hypothetical protein
MSVLPRTSAASHAKAQHQESEARRFLQIFDGFASSTQQAARRRRDTPLHHAHLPERPIRDTSHIQRRTRFRPARAEKAARRARGEDDD